jgi:hypothetical protein
VSSLLYLCDNLVKGSLWEDVRVVFHIFLGVLVSLKELELKAAEEDSVTEEEVTLNIVVTADGVTVLLALHELTSNTTRVLIADLINLNGVITTVEGNNEPARLIIRLSGDELRLESEDMHILLEHFLHVNLRRLRL